MLRQTLNHGGLNNMGPPGVHPYASPTHAAAGLSHVTCFDQWDISNTKQAEARLVLAHCWPGLLGPFFALRAIKKPPVFMNTERSPRYRQPHQGARNVGKASWKCQPQSRAHHGHTTEPTVASPRTTQLRPSHPTELREAVQMTEALAH